MKYRLCDILETESLQTMMDSLSQASGMAATILDVDGTVFVASCHQEICAAFHRARPEMEALCLQSERQIAKRLSRIGTPPPEGYITSPCGNGLIHVGLPLSIEGNHLGDLLFSQFLHEPPDEEFFRTQAQAFDLDAEAYISALRKVPILSQEKLRDLMDFYSNFVMMLIKMGIDKIKYLEEHEELRRSEEKFRTLFENTDAVLFIVAQDGRILEANTVACELLGYPNDELLKLSINQVMIPEEDESARKRIEWGQRSVQPTFETALVRRDGSSFPVELSVRMVDFDGKPVLLGIALNITERKQAQDALRESEARFRSIFEASAAGMALISLDGRVLEVNEAMSRLSGFTKDECLKMTVEEITHPDDIARTQELYGQVLMGELPFIEYEKRYQRKDGTTAWGHTTVALIRDDDGNPQYFVGLIQDITERIRAEEELRQSEEKFKRLSQEFKTLLDGIPDMLTLLSPELKIVWINKAGAEYSQIEGGFHSGKACYSLWHNRTEPCKSCPVLRAFRSGHAQEGLVSTPDGRQWSIKAFPLHDRAGKVTNVIELASDITEKTKFRIEAERASRLASLGELAAGVAHEINNPNGLILMNASLVQRIFDNLQPVLEAQYREHGDFPAGRLEYSEFREELPELLSEILESARKIKHIVEDLKDFARPSDEVHQESLDLNAVVEAAVRLAGNAIKNSTESFVVSYEDNLPKVKGSFQSIEQVVVNLIVNACQALPARARGIFVSTSADKAARGGSVLVEVRDEGVGVSEQNLPHITDPFFTTKRDEGGTGLGLSVSARIIKDHGGHLTFTSKKSEGMTATISLPAFKEI